MYKISLLERLFDIYIQALILSFVAIFSLLATTTQLSLEKRQTLSGVILNLDFAHFSPAFAAFEDDFLFSDQEAIQETFRLKAGQRPMLFLEKSAENNHETQLSLNSKIEEPLVFANFDGTADLHDIPTLKKTDRTLNKKTWAAVPFTKQVGQKSHQAEELRFGPLFAAVPVEPSSTHNVASNNKSVSRHLGRAVETAQPVNSAQPKNNNGHKISAEEMAYAQPKLENDPNKLLKKEAFDSYKLSGSLSLNGGLAYFGTLETVWVVGNEVLALGSVNTPDASYEISVSELLGEIVVSLYDNDNQLIGEGLLELSNLSKDSDQIRKNIDIHPVNWDGAGQVVHVHSLGGHSYKQNSASNQPISGAQVQLYSFNMSSETDSNGHFQFSNWKKSNSRTLAIASKKGYRDSIFILDSHREALVPLLTEDYYNALFATLEDKGLYNRENKGTIYGSLLGAESLSGYKVQLRKEKAIYFDSLNMADLNLVQTSANGLFAFVGLQDGDYELTLEKDGEIIDHRILAVEQGKVSPVIIDLKKVYKHIEFFDPLNPSVSVGSVDISFFDGVFHKKLDKKQRLKTTLTGGNEPNMIEYSVGVDVGRAFVSRNRGLERLPLLADETLQSLAKSHDMPMSQGLIFGFIETNQPYRVDLAEGSPRATLYFNEKGQIINPEKNQAYGFIMGGFYQGINTLIVKDLRGETLVSDIVFSDHTSISIINSYIHEL